jgi:hypothetical protein
MNPRKTSQKAAISIPDMIGSCSRGGG